VISKASLRADVLDRVRRMPPREAAQRSRAVLERVKGLPAFQKSRTVLTYVALPTEVDTRPLISELLAEPRMVLVPVVRPDGRMIWSHLHALEELTRGPLGAPEPGPAHFRPYPPGATDLVLVPGVAFTPRGERLGRGGGYFDRFLAEHAGPSIGLAFEEQVVDALPMEPHDRRVSYVVTDTGVYRCSD
jgi:5-formyltetrahydrofolate cyclo-ligase